MRARLVVLGLAVLSAACDDSVDPFVGPGNGVGAPQNLTYVVEPNGDDDRPTGILLRWDFDPDPDIAVWRIYSRPDAASGFLLRGTSTSNTFHDAGLPHLDYFVTAEDLNAVESAESNTIRVDERLALPAPDELAGVSLDGAVAVFWDDAPAIGFPDEFSNYRVYSASFNLDTGFCGTDWGLEGTTVSPEFVVGVLPNGVPRCFAVSSQHILGYESLWSPIDDDTPRPDSRNILLYTDAELAAESGFSFWRDLDADDQVDPNELGLVGSNVAPNDFLLDDNAGAPRFVMSGGVFAQDYAGVPIGDLTDIDFAPLGGYSATPFEPEVGHGYVFEIDVGDGFPRYGALRVTHKTSEFVIFDWSYQTDPGNPELIVR
ncbi:MAG: hypothetical protein ACREMH_11725 [Gemmatimonadales bacterium]